MQVILPCFHDGNYVSDFQLLLFVVSAVSIGVDVLQFSYQFCHFGGGRSPNCCVNVKLNLCHLHLIFLYQLLGYSKRAPQEKAKKIIFLNILYFHFFWQSKVSDIVRILSDTSDLHESRNSVSFSVWLEEYDAVLSELASVFTWMFYVLLS